MTDTPPPIFVKANLKFVLYGREFEFRGTEVSLYGATGLRVTQFNPADTIGMEVAADIHVLGDPGFEFRTTAHLTAEATADNVFAGLKFACEPRDRTRLDALIRTTGFYPSVYIRKFPRIPARESIPAMPLRAILSDASDTLYAMDIANMSPGGVLLYSENPKAAILVPSTKIDGQIEPRGSSLACFEFEGLICRTLAEAQPGTGNIRRHFGIRFSKIPEEQKQSFLEILRMILLNIQQAGLVD